jgi:predicted outer membrane repeat protein
MTAAALLLLCASPAAADTFAVTNGDDTSGAGSLRSAIESAEANDNEPTVDLIPITFTGNIDVTASLPEITEPVTIDGPGAGSLNVRRALAATGQFTLVFVNPSAGVTVTIEGLTISGAEASSFSGGGLQMFGPGTLVLESIVVKDNSSTGAGGLFYNNGFTSIRNSTFSGNHSENEGGAILGSQFTPGTHGEAELINSTIDDNSAVGFGGGVYLANEAHLRILSSTITRNEADSDGNGAGDGGGLNHNADDPGASDEFQVANTLLAGNFTGDDDGDTQCSGNAYTSLGYNLRSDEDAAEIDSAGCIGFGAPGDFVSATPMIAGAPATNGGPTPNVALLAGSPAIDAGNPATPGGAFPVCPATDQRGLFRGGAAGRCDIGSYELNASSTPPTNGGGGTLTPPATTPTAPTSDPAAAIKKCKKKFPKGPKRKKCIRRAKQRA